MGVAFQSMQEQQGTSIPKPGRHMELCDCCLNKFLHAHLHLLKHLQRAVWLVAALQA